MVSLVLWVTKFLARQRLLFASFIVNLDRWHGDNDMPDRTYRRRQVQEGKVPSSNFTLEAVAIMVRHGERMPLRRVRNHHLLGCRQPPSTSSPSVGRNSPLHSFVNVITKHPSLPLKNIFLPPLRHTLTRAHAQRGSSPGMV
ncbi:hypothetical protein MRX96_018482 [Rhipicephalus microplus]